MVRDDKIYGLFIDTGNNLLYCLWSAHFKIALLNTVYFRYHKTNRYKDMNKKLQQLPIGKQTFKDVIEENNLYIDKTKIALKLIQNNKYIFLARPRRFGKSLFMDTLQEIFEANQALFKGLYIYDKHDWNVSYPVIKISFSGGIHNKVELNRNLLRIIESNQDRLGVECKHLEDINIYFEELIEKLYQHYQQKVVILIDEYDKPILDNLDKLDDAKEIRDSLRDFYTKIKDNDKYIKFAMLTGVSKFSKVSVFSGLNNLKDISLNPEFGDICGYTQNDIETTIRPYLQGADLEKLKTWYNGYNFFGSLVYNPFDILLFIDNKFVFDSYWFETGTPTFLVNFIKNNHYFLPDFEDKEIDKSIANSFDIEKLNLETIMFQAGYLTIKEVVHEFDWIYYKLGYPNREVRVAFNTYLTQLFLDNVVPIKRDILRLFQKGNIQDLEPIIKRLFASIAYNNFTKNEIANYEGFYASVIYAYFASMPIEIIAEDITNKGRIDLTIQAFDKTYIFEFKVIDESPLKQIKTKKYYQKYKGEVYIIGIVFNPDDRNVSHFEWEKID